MREMRGYREIYQKDHSRANRGMALESYVNFANERYQSNGIAVMHKVPTEFIPIRDKKGQIVSCKVEKKSCADYLGHYKGTAVAVEAKSTTRSSISFLEVQDHQAVFLDDWISSRDGQMAFVLVSFGMERFYMVPWQFWRAGREAWIRFRETGDRPIRERMNCFCWEWITPATASVKEEYLLGDWEIPEGGKYGLPYLQIIDRIAGGKTKNESRRPGH